MSQRKNKVNQLQLENLIDICGEMSEDDKIVESQPKKKKKEVKSKTNTNEKDTMTLEKINTIEKIIKIYPKLKKDKDMIISNILTKQDTKQYVTPIDLLHKIEINGKTYYRDNNLQIIDETCNLVGFYTHKDNVYEYTFFSQYI
jgi:hypothetical protein